MEEIILTTTFGMCRGSFEDFAINAKIERFLTDRFIRRELVFFGNTLSNRGDDAGHNIFSIFFCVDGVGGHDFDEFIEMVFDID